MNKKLVLFILLISSSLLFVGCEHLRKLGPALTEKKTTTQKEPTKTKPPQTLENKTLEKEPKLPKPLARNTFQKRNDEDQEKMEDFAIIVSYFRFLNSLPEKAVKQEYDRTLEEFNRDQNPVNRIRLAMVLGLTKNPHQDTPRSLTLLKQYMDDPDQDPALKDFSYLLHTVLQAHRTETQERQSLREKLTKEGDEIKKLNKMIEELKAIEKNIMKRENAS